MKLDRIFCYEMPKVGVLNVGPGQQNDEKAILRSVLEIGLKVDFNLNDDFSNQFGSTFL